MTLRRIVDSQMVVKKDNKEDNKEKMKTKKKLQKK